MKTLKKSKGGQMDMEDSVNLFICWKLHIRNLKVSKARVVCTVVVQDQFEGAAARGQECNGGEFMSECELTNCVWGKRACQGAGREFLHLTVIGPDPWDAHALFI